MRRLLGSSVFLLPLASFLLAACGDMPARDVAATQIAQPTATVVSLPTQPGKEAVEIEVHLWQDYNRNEVQIEIDGQVVFSDVVTTNDILSLAARIPLSVSEGSHRISVMINDATAAETTFRTQDLVVIAVSIDPSEENIWFEFLGFYPAYR